MPRAPRPPQAPPLPVAVPNPGTYTVAEAAAVLDCHPNTVYRLIQRGAFGATVVYVGRGIRIGKESLHRWLGEQRAA